MTSNIYMYNYIYIYIYNYIYIYIGAIMFRGFYITEGIHFEQVVQKFQPELSNEYRGTSPRQTIPGTQVMHC